MPLVHIRSDEYFTQGVIKHLAKFLNAGGDLSEALQQCRDKLLFPPPKYSPNRIYMDEMFSAFQREWDNGLAQEMAYERIAVKFRLDVNKGDSFIRSFRNWNKARYGVKASRRGDTK